MPCTYHRRAGPAKGALQGHPETWHEPEKPHVRGAHPVVEFASSHGDQKIREWDPYAASLALAIEHAGSPGDRRRDGDERNKLAGVHWQDSVWFESIQSEAPKRDDEPGPSGVALSQDVGDRYVVMRFAELVRQHRVREIVERD